MMRYMKDSTSFASSSSSSSIVAFLFLCLLFLPQRQHNLVFADAASPCNEIDLASDRIVETNNGLPPGDEGRFSFIGSSDFESSTTGSCSIGDGGNVSFATDIFEQETQTEKIGLFTKIKNDFFPIAVPIANRWITIRDNIIFGSQVSFRGVYQQGVDGGDNVTISGFFLRRSNGFGGTDVIANTNSMVSGGCETFASFDKHARSGISIFTATRSGQNGNDLYRSDFTSAGLSELSLILAVGEASPLKAPTAATVFSVSDPFARGDSFTCTVVDSNGNRGIVGNFGSGEDSSLETLVDTITGMAPNNRGRFTDIGPSAFNDDKLVVFKGSTSTGQGIYTYRKDTGGAVVITTIVESGTIAPGTPGDLPFFAFRGPSIDGGNILFTASTTANETGIFLSNQGKIYKILFPGDTFNDAFTVSAIKVTSPYSLEGNRFVLAVSSFFVSDNGETIDVGSIDRFRFEILASSCSPSDT